MRVQREIAHFRAAHDQARRCRLCSFAFTRRRGAVRVWPIRSTTLSKVRRGRPRQFSAMWQKRRCSIQASVAPGWVCSMSGCGDATQPNPPDGVAHFLGSDDDQRLRRRRPPLRPAGAAHKTFVDLHLSRQAIAAWPDHRPAQLVQPRPCPCRKRIVEPIRKRCYPAAHPTLLSNGAGDRHRDGTAQGRPHDEL
jgi:hypothetical protein